MHNTGSTSARELRRSKLTFPRLAIGVLVSALWACGNGTDRTELSPAAGGGPGQVLYLTYCQGCHGVQGRGNGPAAPSLRTPPPDLTELWKRYGTPLDRERLAAYIDGRWLVSVHGAREMPVWGAEFFADAPPLAANVVEGGKRHLIDVLVEFLETLQTERQL